MCFLSIVEMSEVRTYYCQRSDKWNQRT